MASTRHPRSRTGCWICRLRKKKCDETKPTCQQCRNLRIQCDGYGVAQPTWMRDPAAAKRKKEEIKLQIGKRGRRRRKALVRITEGSGAERSSKGDEVVQGDRDSGGGGFAAEPAMGVKEVEGTTSGNGDEQQFVFETFEGRVQLLKPFPENPAVHSTGAIAMLDSPRPPIECYRCPIRNSFARSVVPMSGYGILDAHTGKPLLENVKSGVILVPTPPPLWKPNTTTDPNTRTKEEEINGDEYDVIIASLMSSSTPKHHASPSPAELSDPSLVPPIRFTNDSEVILVKHYIRNIFRSTYSAMSETRIHELLRDVVIPGMTTNPGLLRGFLSSSAVHLAMTEGKSEECVKALLTDAWEHRGACIEDLKKRLKDGGASEQILASVLALTTFEIYTSLPNWKYHLQAAIECLVQLDLLNKPIHSINSKLLMSRVVWMDILSALTLGRAPQLWANYREILSRPVHERAYCGLLETMGCDDTVMFLISEVMCVEDYKHRTLEDGMISWTRGYKRAIELDIRLRDRDLPVAVKLPLSPEPPCLPLLPSADEGDDSNELDPTGLLASPSPLSSFSSLSAISQLQSPESVSDGGNTPKSSYFFPQLPSPPYVMTPLSPPATVENTTASPSKERAFSPSEEYPFVDATSDEYSIPPELPTDQGIIVKATTAAFRTATRIHLWSVGLGFYPRLSFFQQLLEELIIMIALIPAGLSRVVAWPLLVGGCMATEQKDREFFAGRCAAGHGGSLRDIERVMREVWKRRDETDRIMGAGHGQEVHWRSVMREQGLEILLV